MSRELTEVDIFLASPTDVVAERESVEEAVEELNDNWQRQLGLRLNLILMEKDAVPGFGKYPQDVLNQQIPTQIQAFVAIFWSRIGTPTGRAQSGTVEEFERAYEQWKNDPRTIRVMLYFKTAPVPRKRIDPKQIEKVDEFKVWVDEHGGLYHEFESTDEFRKVIRKHLTKFAQEAAAQYRSKDSPESVAPKQKDIAGPALAVAGATAPASHAQQRRPSDVSDEEGLIDLVERYQHEMATVTNVAKRMSGTVETLRAQTNESASELNQLDPRNTPQHMKRPKRVLNAWARQLHTFASLVAADAPVMNSSFNRANTAFDKVIDLAHDFGEEGITNIKRTRPMLVNFIDVLDRTIESISKMRTSLLSAPRATTQFNRARRAAVNSLDELLYTLNTAKRVMESSLAVLDALP